MTTPTPPFDDEVFFVLEAFSRRLGAHLAALRTLCGPPAPRVRDASAYYRPDTDTALLAVRARPGDRDRPIDGLRALGRRAGFPSLDPAQLADGDRRRFYDHYLREYPTSVLAAQSGDCALRSLAARLGLPAPRAEVTPRPTVALAAPAPPREPVSAPPKPLTPTGATILARYLRGDAWMPARVRNVNMRGAHLAAGAVPRVGDAVPVALGLGKDSAVVSGRVVAATTDHEARTQGATGFRIAFSNGESAGLKHLEALLRRARAQGVSLAPPPPRSAPRFALRWPVQLVAGRTQAFASALDISEGGLFLATRSELRGDDLDFQLPLDERGDPIMGRARIARVVPADMATARGLAQGYGVEIIDLSSSDEARFSAFLTRVSERGQRRVVVAAAPQRAAGLSAALGAVGYEVAGYTAAHDAQATLDDGSSRAPDLVVLEAGLRANEPRAAEKLAASFEERGARCIWAGGDAAATVRDRVDRALSVTA